MSPLAAKVVEIARSCVGVRESPSGSNRGPEVDGFLLAVGLDPNAGHYSWCAAFVSWCMREAVLRVGGPPQFRASARAMGLVEFNHPLLMRAPADEPCIFVIDHGSGHGHCGFVTALLPQGRMATIEGNTGPGPAPPEMDRNGDGVYERRDREISDCCAFIRIG
jgi:hypothetical protein